MASTSRPTVTVESDLNDAYEVSSDATLFVGETYELWPVGSVPSREQIARVVLAAEIQTTEILDVGWQGALDWADRILADTLDDTTQEARDLACRQAEAVRALWEARPM